MLKLGVRLTDDHHVFAREDGAPVSPGSLTRSFREYSHVLPGMQDDAVAKVDAAIQAAMNKPKTK